MLWRLSIAAAIAAFGEVMLGSWTRIEGAGMTCPDWPHCDGRWIPSLANGTVWEWTHRLSALLLCVFVAGVLAAAWPRRRAPFIGRAIAAVGALFVFQVFLGAATVRLANSPISVVWHWGTAMAFVASLAMLAIFAQANANGWIAVRSQGRGANGALIVLALTSAIAFLTMCVGAYVSSSGAGLACISIPGCSGNVVVYTQGQLVQMVHRFFAAATLLFASGACAAVWAWRCEARVRWTATIGLALVFVQVLLGLLNVALRLPLDLREAHAANAALTFLAFVSAATFASLKVGSPERLPAR